MQKFERIMVIISEGPLSMTHKYQVVKENENFQYDLNIKYFGTLEYCWEFKFLSTLDEINNVAHRKHLEKQNKKQEQVKTGLSSLVTGHQVALFVHVLCVL